MRKLGGWAADASVKRYEKHARAMAEAARLSAATRRFAEQVEKQLKPLLEGRVAPPALPSLTVLGSVR